MICEPLRVRTRAPTARRLKFTVASKTSQINRTAWLYFGVQIIRGNMRAPRFNG